ncbi:UDP-2,3-diacylglucosamine diphosphatase [Gilvimarinus agarilyticus]|uniref:UDP-2,3-diacylglucosamine pyrophosphatase LpxH n=1 Tax=Reichenbachiella agariperforans TaxID=156994 RepID=A0A1M6PWM2_REIAG|nr:MULTISPECIES: UDP-2,3-diacylglucosamine diphosphatase [Reichenbachiella]MBU2884831.1 UDP-2,3-diacylglucosamine diphosphatase [Gilvimarinus agarilyticus]MBU2913001.1 UDP-2,3-diacylglucosamine diphosphatase [Reichenbachiella agariperforans]RJE72871.1 UDP-2,3-diacylglucosamine hydrolase [Reichenbachiella sp. MSK19-1]SHK12302.1 UDP-2,3-diacylglucosamine pyrophosphatase LpxH [Reichenbachiella agariperforans]
MKKSEKRSVDILILSDIHLGTYGCRAKELLVYLKSISPKEVILNGDIIDIWQFSKRYWPKSHMKIVSYIFKWISKGVKVTYLTGNHDEMLRKFEGFTVGSFELQNKMVLELNGEKAWVFHGDVFDITMQHSRWVAQLGAIGYDSLIMINQVVNFVSEFMGKGRISLSKKVKNSVKSAVKYINQFEQTATEIAADNGFRYVICGHIHHPEMREYVTEKEPVMYLNSGDWIENLTSLEYNDGKWSIFQFKDEDFPQLKTGKDREQELEEEIMDLSDKTPKELYGRMLQEMLKN